MLCKCRAIFRRKREKHESLWHYLNVEEGLNLESVRLELVPITWNRKEFILCLNTRTIPFSLVMELPLQKYVMCKMYTVIKHGHWWNILFNILMGKKEIRILNSVISMTLKINSVLLQTKTSGTSGSMNENLSGDSPRKRHSHGQ